jgi:ABC-type phosphate transport system permease subunit
MIDATRQLRWYLGLALVFAAVAPLLMMSLVASDPEAPDAALVPVFVGAPVNVVGVVLALRGMFTDDPIISARWLKTGAAMILVGVVLLFAVRAFTT